MPKKIKPVCGNCQLYDPSKSQCSIVILMEGKRQHIPVDPEDKCFFENEFTAIHDGKAETFIPADEIKQVKWWVEDPKTGKKTDGNGKVKMEYPEGFFGTGD